MIKLIKKCIRKYIKGHNNKIIFKNSNKKRIPFIYPFDSTIRIYGNNNLIEFNCTNLSKLPISFPEGLKIYIWGSNNTVKIELPLKFENVLIQMEKDNNTFSIGTSDQKRVKDAKFYIEEGSSIIIGKDHQMHQGGLVIIANNNYKTMHKVLIGNNVYIARDCLIRTSDGHTIVDSSTMEALNEPQDVIIENNVWITSRCTILKGGYIPSGCIVGACSLVNKPFKENNTIIAGVPAKIIKHNVTWHKDFYSIYQEKRNKN